MFKLIFFLIFVAISIYSEVSKARKKAQQEAARRHQPQQATADDFPEEGESDPWDDILDDAQRSLNNQKDEDLEEDRERMRRERDEILARKAREQKMREEAERERKLFEEHQRAEALAIEHCVEERMAEPRKPSAQRAKTYSQIDEGGRSTAGGATAAEPSDKVGNLTPSDARRAVILDAIFNRPQF